MAGRSRAVALTDPDRRVLEFMAEHRMVLIAHVQRRLGTTTPTAAARMRRLSRAGYLTRNPTITPSVAPHQITGAGLRAIGSDLRAPRQMNSSEIHDVGLAWLWLAAQEGRFGALREVISERRMRSHDRREHGREAPLAVRLGGFSGNGQPNLHSPDLLLIDHSGKRIAIELELSSKTRIRRESILAGYAAAGNVDAVLYLAGNAAIAREVSRSARKMGLADRLVVHRAEVQLPAPARSVGAAGRQRAHAVRRQLAAAL